MHDLTAVPLLHTIHMHRKHLSEWHVDSCLSWCFIQLAWQAGPVPPPPPPSSAAPAAAYAQQAASSQRAMQPVHSQAYSPPDASRLPSQQQTSPADGRRASGGGAGLAAAPTCTPLAPYTQVCRRWTWTPTAPPRVFGKAASCAGWLCSQRPARHSEPAARGDADGAGALFQRGHSELPHHAGAQTPLAWSRLFCVISH